MKWTLFAFVIASNLAYSQVGGDRDFIQEIKRYDVSSLWTLTRFTGETNEDTIERTEPLGFIGENYQRFYIHFISIIRDPSDPLLYHVFGKSRVKNNICAFQGTMRIDGAIAYTDNDVPGITQGSMSGTYAFYEDPKQKSTGIFNGSFQSDFYVGSDHQIKYNAFMIVADGYENNSFAGTWTSYASKGSKKCNWGDYRIPESKELDCGAGEFVPYQKYASYGWQSYEIAHGYATPADDDEVDKAQQEEDEKWWIDKQ